MRNAEKLRWMSEQELIDQLASMPGNSPLRRLRVEVTKDDCKHSNPGHPLSCAISVAMRRVLPTASFVCTRHNRMTVTIGKRYLHFEVNDRSSNFIKRFDELVEVSPAILTFRLVDVGKVKQHSPERKAQINAARNKRREEGRPDKAYHSAPLRLRTTKSAKAEIKAAIERAKRGAA
jgi:hypothetical protein